MTPESAVITTAEELDALPDGSIVLDGDAAGWRWAWRKAAGGWVGTDADACYEFAAYLAELYSPFTLVHRGPDA